jgi:integrase
MSPAAKAKIRNQMSALFTHAIHHRLYEGENPIRTVTQSPRRKKIPIVLTLQQMIDLLSHIDQETDRIAVLMASVTSLRKSELRALKWCDLDAENAVLNLKRGKSDKYLSKLKTEASRRPVTIPVELVEELLRWRSISRFRTDDDWILASHYKQGKGRSGWITRCAVTFVLSRNGLALKAVSVGIHSGGVTSVLWCPLARSRKSARNSPGTPASR